MNLWHLDKLIRWLKGRKHGANCLSCSGSANDDVAFRSHKTGEQFFEWGRIVTSVHESHLVAIDFYDCFKVEFSAIV